MNGIIVNIAVYSLLGSHLLHVGIVETHHLGIMDDVAHANRLDVRTLKMSIADLAISH